MALAPPFHGYPAAGGLTDLLASTPTMSWKKVESWAEFIAIPGVVEGPAGVWNFDEPIFSAGTITAPAGSRLVGGENSSLFGIQVFASTWFFDVDAAAISGPLRLQGLTVVQLNAGASAFGISVSTSLGRLAIVIECVIVGGRIGIELINNASVVAIDLIGITQCDRAVVVRGIVGEIVVQIVSPFNMSLSTSVGFEVESSAILSAASALVFNGCTAAVNTNQSAFAFAHAMAVTSPALVQIASGGISGPQGQVIRQTSPGVTDMDMDDDRLVIVGNTSHVSWKAVAVAGRTDTGDPLIAAVGFINTDTILPYEDALGNLEIEATTLAHFAFFKDGGDPLNYYWEYIGPRQEETTSISTEFLADRAAGTGFASMKWQRDAAPAYGGFVDVANSDVPWENSNSYKAVTGFALSSSTNTGDRFRPVWQNNADTVDIRVASVKISMEITS